MHQVPKILFCHETLPVSGIFCAHHQELSAVHMAIGMFHAGYVAAAQDTGKFTSLNHSLRRKFSKLPFEFSKGFLLVHLNPFR
jgi:hypothetical protein